MRRLLRSLPARVIAVVGAILAIGLLWSLRAARSAEDEARASDAIQVIAGDLADGEPFPDPAGIEREILRLGSASVITIGISSAGRPTDPWGTPFRVTRSADGRTVCTSAGSDRRFDTADDLTASYRRPPVR